ncbi:MAG TPA: toll/interleukin-1 receptor domain-containing protein [Pyrinomonadaceae bacterium]|jgi:hypothetical protein|nr:toll/interleukin-1 receptor domain-containing protein [Pyrinomonadaceae bacterium]
MAHDIFISYSAEDRASAEAVCGALEKASIGCWIAPRDIEPGDFYGEAIIRAISESQMLVLIFSSHANESPHVLTEVDRAYSKRKSIVRLNLENVDISQRFEYYLSTAQWLDASDPLTAAQLQTLTTVVNSKLGRPSSSPRSVQPSSQVKPTRRPAKKRARRTPTVKATPAPAAVERPASRSRPKRAGTGRGYIVGRVNHYYDGLGVAGVDVLDTIQVGDTVRILSPVTDFEEKVRSIQLNGVAIERVTGNYQIGLKVSQTVAVGDEIFKVVFRSSEPTSSNQPVKETLVGTVQHYYGRAGAAILQLSKALKVGDTIRVRGVTTDFTQTISSMELDRAPVTRAKGGVQVGVGVTEAVRVGDLVYVLSG